jgi:type I restriction enzyme M protein
MSRKRNVLEQLKRDELLAAVDRFELSVEDRRVKGGLVEALAASRKAGLAAILDDLSRNRLKEVCRSLRLEDSGREKAVLINRLVGENPAPPPAVEVAPYSSSPEKVTIPRASRAATDNAPAGLLTREALERYLWSAADILRGSIDSSDYKNYILGLLFLKRLSDRFEEESEVVRQKGDDPEDRDEHQFFVPPRARWASLKKAVTGIGEELNRASAELEDMNPALEGVLAGIDFNDERKLGDTRQRDSLLSRLVQHFSKIVLRNDNLSEPDLLGRAYEYLIERFADDAGKKGGEFYTPHQVVKLMVEILAPKQGMRISDPTCGSGGMLIQCAEYVERHGGDRQNLSLYGQEKNLGTWALCKMNLLLHGLPDVRIFKGDTIRDPKMLEEDGALMLFDLVIANPPFSLEEWGREVAEKDPYGRFRFGIPPKSRGDLAFVQHMVALLNRTGRMAVVMPHGILFRGGAEEDIRKGLIEEDWIEAVIGLAPNLFYGTGIPASILVLNRAKPQDRKKKFLFIDGSGEFKEGLNQNVLTDSNIARLSEAIHCFEDIPRFCHVATLSEIRANVYNLNLTRYLDVAEQAEAVSVETALHRLREAEAARVAAENRMRELLGELGYEL